MDVNLATAITTAPVVAESYNKIKVVRIEVNSYGSRTAVEVSYEVYRITEGEKDLLRTERASCNSLDELVAQLEQQGLTAKATNLSAIKKFAKTFINVTNSLDL